VTSRARSRRAARAAAGVSVAASPPLDRRVCYLVALLEGVSVMATELLVAKMLAPLYGDSLYTWSTVLGTTLIALAAGYFAGGVVVDRAPRPEVLLAIVLAAAGYLLVVPALLGGLTALWIDRDPIASTIACAAIGLVPPLFLLGMVPSFLIRLLAGDAAESGAVAGRVYAVSSLGGMASALGIGLIVIPELGLTRPMLGTSSVLALPPLAVLLARRRLLALAYLAVLPLAFWHAVVREAPTSRDIRVREYSEGLLGQVLVADQRLPGGGPDDFFRVLYLNRMGQTVIDARTGEPLSADYIDHVLPFAATRPPGARVLLLGLGGGSMVKELVRLGFTVDAVELDPRIIAAASRWFMSGTPADGVRYVADDARHVLRTTDDKYDIVVFDVFRGERPPAHVFTRESLEEVERLLADDGIVLLNLIGRVRGERSAGVRAVLRTLREVGLETLVVAMPETENVEIVASRRPLDLSRPKNPRFRSRLEHPIETRLTDVTAAELADAPVLTDDRPLLDVLYLDAAEYVRRQHTREFTKRYLAGHVPLFD